jgi:hypothetical protein
LHKQRFFTTEHFHALFLEIMQLPVEETNRYYHQYLEIVDTEHFSLPDMTTQEMYLFSIIVQMGHDQRDSLFWPFTETQ